MVASGPYPVSRTKFRYRQVVIVNGKKLKIEFERSAYGQWELRKPVRLGGQLVTQYHYNVGIPWRANKDPEDGVDGFVDSLLAAYGVLQ